MVDSLKGVKVEEEFGLFGNRWEQIRQWYQAQEGTTSLSTEQTRTPRVNTDDTCQDSSR